MAKLNIGKILERDESSKEERRERPGIGEMPKNQ